MSRERDAFCVPVWFFKPLLLSEKKRHIVNLCIFCDLWRVTWKYQETKILRAKLISREKYIQLFWIFFWYQFRLSIHFLVFLILFFCFYLINAYYCTWIFFNKHIMYFQKMCCFSNLHSQLSEVGVEKGTEAPNFWPNQDSKVGPNNVIYEFQYKSKISTWTLIFFSNKWVWKYNILWGTSSCHIF